MKVGQRYRSVSASTQVIVMRAPAEEVVLACAGEEMVLVDGAAAPAPAATGSAPESTEEALLVGKRYIDDESGVEVLCTAAGPGPVSVDGRPLGLAEAKLLPSSD